MSTANTTRNVGAGHRLRTNDIAYGLISFANLADYEAYRARLKADPAGTAIFKIAEEQRLILAEERTFLARVE